MRLRIFNIERIALYDGLSLCQVSGLVPEGSGVVHEHVAQGYIAAVCGLMADGVFLAEVFSLDYDVRHKDQLKMRRILPESINHSSNSHYIFSKI